MEFIGKRQRCSIVHVDFVLRRIVQSHVQNGPDENCVWKRGWFFQDPRVQSDPRQCTVQPVIRMRWSHRLVCAQFQNGQNIGQVQGSLNGRFRTSMKTICVCHTRQRLSLRPSLPSNIFTNFDTQYHLPINQFQHVWEINVNREPAGRVVLNFFFGRMRGGDISDLRKTRRNEL